MNMESVTSKWKKTVVCYLVVFPPCGVCYNEYGVRYKQMEENRCLEEEGDEFEVDVPMW
jgi:hypothetical protein